MTVRFNMYEYGKLLHTMQISDLILFRSWRDIDDSRCNMVIIVTYIYSRATTLL